MRFAVRQSQISVSYWYLTRPQGSSRVHDPPKRKARSYPFSSSLCRNINTHPSPSNPPRRMGRIFQKRGARGGWLGQHGILPEKSFVARPCSLPCPAGATHTAFFPHATPWFTITQLRAHPSAQPFPLTFPGFRRPTWQFQSDRLIRNCGTNCSYQVLYRVLYRAWSPPRSTVCRGPRRGGLRSRFRPSSSARLLTTAILSQQGPGTT